MKNATIYSIAAICGVGAFVYTLTAGAPRYRGSFVGNGIRGYMGADALPNDIPALEQMVLENRRPGAAWYRLARLYREDGREAAEMEAWRNAAPLRLAAAKRNDPAARRPEQFAPWFEAGFAYSMAGLTEEAKEPLTQAEELLTQYAHNTDEGDAWYKLGWARKLLGNEADARIAWSRAIATLPPKETSIVSGDLYNLACYRCLMGETDEALDVLERAIIAGYRDDRHAVHDEDFEAIKDDPRFKAAIQHMREANNGVRIERGP